MGSVLVQCPACSARISGLANRPRVGRSATPLADALTTTPSRIKPARFFCAGRPRQGTRTMTIATSAPAPLDDQRTISISPLVSPADLRAEHALDDAAVA